MEAVVKTGQELANELLAKEAENKAWYNNLLKEQKDEYNKLKKEFEEAKTKYDEDSAEVKTLKTAMVEQGKAIAMLQEIKTSGEGSSLEGALLSALQPYEQEFKSWLNNDSKQKEIIDFRVKVSTKAAVTIGEGNTIAAGSTQYTLTENTGIISPIRKRQLRYLVNVSVGRIGTNNALWVEEKDEQGAPVFLAEATDKTQLSVRYEEATKKVKKIAAYVKVTTELLADLPQLVSYIQNNLLKRLDIKIEDQLFSGDDTGENLKGLFEYASAFDAGSEANTVPFANEYDVIDAVGTQVEEDNGMANAMFIHPRTHSKLRKLKDADGNYIFPKGMPDDLMEINGMRIIKTNAIGADDFIGGDLSVVNVLIREELRIQIGLDGNDFTKNLKTMLAEARLVQFVSANDVQVIVKGTFSTAKAALLQV